MNLGSSNVVTVGGKGGIVNAGGQSVITVNNLGGEGAGPITVNTPSGGQTIVPAGAQGVIVRT